MGNEETKVEGAATTGERHNLYTTPLQRRHGRQSDIPAAFADATLAAAIKGANTDAKRAAASKARRQAARLVARGELTAEQVADCRRVLRSVGAQLKGESK